MNIKLDFGLDKLAKAEFTTLAGLCNFGMVLITCFYFAKYQFAGIVGKEQAIPKLLCVLVVFLLFFFIIKGE
jgi:hypothetical protein